MGYLVTIIVILLLIVFIGDNRRGTTKAPPPKGIYLPPVGSHESDPFEDK